MKAVVISEPGGAEQLIVTERPTPELKPGWSLVKIIARGINHSEIFTRKGLSPSVAFPRILGIECVGIIERTTAPEELPEGQKVVSIMGEMGRAFDGSYAEYALLPNSQIYPVESNLPWEYLAALPETYYTAYGSLLNLKMADGERVLVRGATSGVGVAFLKLLKAACPNSRVTGSSRSLEKAERLLEAGFDEVVLDREGQLEIESTVCRDERLAGKDDSGAQKSVGADCGELQEKTRRYDKVLDLIGPASMEDTCRYVREGGIICSTGQLGGQWYLDGFDPIEHLPANGYLTSFYSGNVTAEKLNAMLRFVETHAIDATPEKVFTLDEIQDAHRYLESQGSFGKVVVVSGTALLSCMT